jgi:thiol-disulfide isomerase/thioredoxin
MINDYFNKSEDVDELKNKKLKNIYNLLNFTKQNSIIMFYLPSCTYCKQLITIWNELSIRFNHDFKFYAVNCDDVDNDNDLLCSKLKVKKYPCIKYVFKNKKRINNYFGVINRDDLFYFLCKYN